jgi:hypothetical protein
MIYLNFPSNEVVINCNGKGFKKMTNLNTLVIKNGNFSKESQYFPSSLRVLEWKKYPSTPLSIMNKASEISLIFYYAYCKLTFTLLILFILISFSLFMQKFENMKVLKFNRDIKCLMSSKFRIFNREYLEEFSFQNCENLITIDTSIGLLTTNVEKQHFLSGFVTTSHS